MSFTLYLDTERWHAHQRRVLEHTPGLVPVMKGNGYGFGLPRLAERAGALGVPTVAVGTSGEIPPVAARFGGDVLVLTPWHPRADPEPDLDPSVVLTVSHLEALRALRGSQARVVVECLTSMRRHGLRPDQLAQAVPLLAGLRVEGFALHLPLVESRHGNVAEAIGWVERLRAAGASVDTLWVSHLAPGELAMLGRRLPGVELRARVGTRLWLGAPEATQARGTVLEAHPVSRGERVGYRQRPVGAGHLLVVSGGTAHGVAMEAPKHAAGVVARAKVAAMGALATVNRALSPFRWQGKTLWFAEPPQMQASLLHLPRGVRPPEVGDELPCVVRMTTVGFDRVVEGVPPRA